MISRSPSSTPLWIFMIKEMTSVYWFTSFYPFLGARKTKVLARRISIKRCYRSRLWSGWLGNHWAPMQGEESQVRWKAERHRGRYPDAKRRCVERKDFWSGLSCAVPGRSSPGQIHTARFGDGSSNMCHNACDLSAMFFLCLELTCYLRCPPLVVHWKFWADAHQIRSALSR